MSLQWARVSHVPVSKLDHLCFEKWILSPIRQKVISATVINQWTKFSVKDKIQRNLNENLTLFNQENSFQSLSAKWSLSNHMPTQNITTEFLVDFFTVLNVALIHTYFICFFCYIKLYFYYYIHATCTGDYEIKWIFIAISNAQAITKSSNLDLGVLFYCCWHYWPFYRKYLHVFIYSGFLQIAGLFHNWCSASWKYAKPSIDWPWIYGR